MKKFLFYLLMALGITSCRSDIEPLFSMPMEVDFEIPAGLAGILTHTFIIRDVKSPLDAFLETFSVDKTQIASVTAGRGELAAIFSETNYQFIDRVSIFIVDSDDVDIRREIYYLDFNNDTSNDNALELLTATSDVASMLEKGSFDMEVKLTFRSFSPTNIQNRLIFELQVFE